MSFGYRGLVGQIAAGSSSLEWNHNAIEQAKKDGRISKEEYVKLIMLLARQYVIGSSETLQRKIELLRENTPIIVRFCSRLELNAVFKTGSVAFGPCARADSFEKLLSVRNSQSFLGPQGYRAYAGTVLGSDRSFTDATAVSNNMLHTIKKLRGEIAAPGEFYVRVQEELHRIVARETSLTEKTLENRDIMKTLSAAEVRALTRFFKKQNAEEPHALRTLVTAITKAVNAVPAEGVVNPYGAGMDIGQHYHGYEIILLLRQDTPVRLSEELFVQESPVDAFLLGICLTVPLRNYADDVASMVVEAALEHPGRAVPVYAFDGRLHWPRR